MNWLQSKLAFLDWGKIGTWFVNTLLYVIVIFVVARAVYGLIIYLLRRLLTEGKGKYLLDKRKADTLFSLIRSMAFYLIFFVAVFHVLEHVLNIGKSTILASASFLGVALGLGAQSLVKDIIGGFFILFEDQFSVGEYVKAGNFSGTVEEMGIRATRLRDTGGELHIIPNGTISAVTNFSRGKMRALVDIEVPYDKDLDYAMKVMHTVCEEVGVEFKDKIVEAPAVQGVIGFEEHRAVLRVVAYTKNNEQGAFERELRRRIYREFMRDGICAF